MSRLISRSLPPFVEGNIYGRLTVTIDEILWSQQQSCACGVTALLQWWGDGDSVTLRPIDVSEYPGATKENTSVTYTIQTNYSLFKAYLKQCNKLNLLIISDSTKEILGHVEIYNLHDLITGIQYQQYFPIITSSGNRIGDLKVGFSLSMNSIPEETCKKMKKRSRKKNKSCHNSFHATDVDERAKTMKKGCKTCTDHAKPIIKTTTMSNTLNLDPPSSPVKCKVPPNTERSNSSEISLLEVLEKGKKLRDAMVMSVLEDVGNAMEEDLLLKLDEIDKEGSSSCYQKLKSHKNGDLISPSEEKLINDYLEGKSMKEEEEILVLNTLHGEDSKQNSKPRSIENCLLKPESSCPTAKNSPRSVSSAKSQPVIDSSSGPITTTKNSPRSVSSAKSQSVIDSSSGPITTNASSCLLKKINCLRLTIDSLTLTHSGKKKIIQTIDNKSKNYDEVPPPGATYFVECHFVDETPRSQSQPWKGTPLRFCSRRQIENVVYFGQSSAHSLRSTPAPSLSTLQDELASTNGLVCWRHLNQRVPALLGNFSLAGLLPRLAVETAATLAITDPAHHSQPHTVLAHLKIKLQLGKDKLYFGLSLLDEPHNIVEVDRSATIFKEHCKKKSKEFGGNIVDLTVKSRPQSARSGCKRHMKRPSPDPTAVQDSLPNLDLPVCSNCNQYLILSHINEYDPMLCTGCYKLLSHNQVHFVDNIEFTIPKHFSTKEQRHHEFLFGIDTVIGFPLFAGIEDGLSCYVDYKFPQISSGLRVEMCKSDLTSRVVSCEAQPSLSSVHRHTLLLPVVLPLSPLLAACSPGITLRLWLRYYRPTPRDHMVAMALLPMNELCLMELEFDKKQQKEAIIKVFELPLALVPSSVTSAYQQYNSLGCIRLSVTYSNHISYTNVQNDSYAQPHFEDDTIREEEKENVEDEFVRNGPDKVKHRLDVDKLLKTAVAEHACLSSHDVRKESIDDITANHTTLENIQTTDEELKAVKNRFWTGPFGNEDRVKDLKFKNKLGFKSTSQITHDVECLTEGISLVSLKEPTKVQDLCNRQNREHSVPVMKEEFDVLAENLEQRFNQLQSELLKEKRKGMNEFDLMVKDPQNINNFHGNVSFNAPSSNSSMESLPFILGPPADFKDSQNITLSSNGNIQCSKSESEPSSSDTISGFLREEKDVLNFGSNDSFPRDQNKPEPVKPKTFKAKVKIDRAVNLKAIKTGCNGKKSKVPPSTWVTFGTGDCCERNCGTADLVCSGQRFSTPVIRRTYNPIWNLSWDIDLPIEYLQQVNKRLVFRVFEENLNAAFGFASANLSILTSGLPCLSSWLSINDLSGACKGQIKIVVTPLEDVSQYQECSVFDTEEDEFEDSKVNQAEAESSARSAILSASFVASPTQVYINDGTSPVNNLEGVVESRDADDNEDDEFMGDDPFSADDIISDYKNTLENNFRNEMAGLENLIRFLRVGSMSNELSFLGATENKENLSSNPTAQQATREIRSVAPIEPEGRYFNSRNISANNHNNLQSCQRDKVLIDACTETTHRNDLPSSSTQDNSEDIISKLLQQISMFQPPSIKITDNTSQTVIPETKEKCTETTVDNEFRCSDKTVHMKDVSTETNDIRTSELSQSDEDNDVPHVCGDLGSMLLQHFLTCRPATVKVTDSSCQTDISDGACLADSTEYVRSRPLGMSTELSKDGIQFPISVSNSDHSLRDKLNIKNSRLTEIDNNIKDLELYLQNNVYTCSRTNDQISDPKDCSSGGSLNGIMDSVPNCVNSISRSSSDVESLESFSQALFVPRETPDGEYSGIPDLDIDSSSTILRRRGTFVIEQSKDKTEKQIYKNDQDDKDVA